MKNKKEEETVSTITQNISSQNILSPAVDSGSTSSGWDAIESSLGIAESAGQEVLAYKMKNIEFQQNITDQNNELSRMQLKQAKAESSHNKDQMEHIKFMMTTIEDVW